VQRPGTEATQPTESEPEVSPFAAVGVGVMVVNEFDEDLPSLDQILSAPITTMIHVPRSLRGRWNELLCKLLSSFLLSGSRPAFQNLFLAPKCLLAPLPRAGFAQCQKVRVNSGEEIHSVGSRGQKGLWSRRSLEKIIFFQVHRF
jgi:hypothetical protein